MRSRLGLTGAALLLLATVAVAACSSGLSPPAATPTPTVAVTTGSDQPAARDLAGLAMRFEGLTTVPTVVAPQRQVGDTTDFEVLALDPDPEAPPSFRTVTTTLEAVSDHAYFFFENAPDQTDLDAGVADFEDKIWPGVTDVFGLPPTPGIDGDPRILIVHADLGQAIGGYVSDSDEHPREIASHGNEGEIVYMNSRGITPGADSYVYVLSHELQHLSHLADDPDEAAWVNEGLSEYAASLVSGTTGSFGDFLDDPDTQLTTWEEIGGSGKHYQASHLFFDYLADQTGGDLGQLAMLPENSVAGVERFLEEQGSDRDFATFVGDWAAANYVDEPSGPFGYPGLTIGPPSTETAQASGTGTVHQFGADYLEIDAANFGAGAQFSFQGDNTTPHLDAQTDADGAFWWSGRSDSSDATLTRDVDLTGVTEATLTFRTWFDIERWFDYGYVAVSQDGGQTWTALAGQQTTTDDPIDVSYGPGYTGVSNGWVDESIDLTPYAGSEIQLRFEYVTDAALNQPGWAIDDISIPQIGLFDDGQRDIGGWHREGFRLLNTPVVQTYQLRLITMTSPPSVQRITVQQGEATISLDGLGSDYQKAIVVVVGTADGTTEPASYRYQLTNPG